MGLLAREIEASGVTTVALALVKEVAVAAHAPRFLYLHWPFGHAWAVGLMVLCDGALLFFFRRQRWV